MSCDICFRNNLKKIYLYDDLLNDYDILLCRFCNKIYKQKKNML